MFQIGRYIQTTSFHFLSYIVLLAVSVISFLVSNLLHMLRPSKREHIVADTSVSPFARARNICRGHNFFARDTKNVSDFVQKYFVPETNVSQFAQPKKHHGQQCVLLYQGFKRIMLISRFLH